MNEMNIYQRINAVMSEIDYVQKDASITGGGVNYRAVTHDNVTALIRPHLVTHGIVVLVEQMKSEILVQRSVKGDPKTDVKMSHYSGDYGVSFVNIDKPDDRATVTINAHAMDNGDKAPGKAMSYATKMAMLKMFSIETGESDESRTAESLPYSESQLAEFMGYIEEENALALAAFCAGVTHTVSDALFNSFPAGKKSEGKAKVRELEKQAAAMLKDCVEGIRNGIEVDDFSAIAEIVAELTKPEKSLVLDRLDETEVATIRRMKKESV